MMSPQERYLRDAEFKYVVDILEMNIRDGKYTPTELREACILAATHFEMKRTDLTYELTEEEFKIFSAFKGLHK